MGFLTRKCLSNARRDQSRGYRFAYLFLGLWLCSWLFACSEKQQELPRGEYAYQYPTPRAEVGNYASNGGVEEGLVSWGVLGTASISRSNKVSRSGAHSIHIYDRTEAWHGITHTFYPFSKGRTYDISIWAKLAEGEEPTELRMTLRSRTTDPVYARLDQQEVTASEWVQLTGVFADLEGAIEFVYVEAANPTASYYLDDMVIVESR